MAGGCVYVITLCISDALYLLGQMAFTFPDRPLESSSITNVPISTQFNPSPPEIDI